MNLESELQEIKNLLLSFGFKVSDKLFNDWLNEWYSLYKIPKLKKSTLINLRAELERKYSHILKMLLCLILAV